MASFVRNTCRTLSEKLLWQKYPGKYIRLNPRTFTSTQSLLKESERSQDEPVFDMENPFEKEQQQCILCKLNIIPDYKNVRLLSQFQSPYTGRVYGRHITGLCKKQQEMVEAEIIKAQNIALMPYYVKEPTFIKDPKLYDIDKPFRPHKF